MSHGQACIKFQPIIDLKSWQFAGFEALARFHDGNSPIVHLNRARYHGHLTKLELSLAEAAIEEALELPFSTVITINLSLASLLSDKLRELVAADHHRWGLELLETSPGADELNLKNMASEMGCLLLIDDAGVAFSTEERIRTLAPHVVKIARSVFTPACTDGVAFERLGDLIRVGREAGSQILVEGIEKPEHLGLAQQLGVDYAQGFLFGKALAPRDVATQLADINERFGVEIPCSLAGSRVTASAASA